MCSSFASGSFDIDVIFHVHCTKPVWCVTSRRSACAGAGVAAVIVVDTGGDGCRIAACVWAGAGVVDAGGHGHGRVTACVHACWRWDRCGRIPACVHACTPVGGGCHAIESVRAGAGVTAIYAGDTVVAVLPCASCLDCRCCHSSLWATQERRRCPSVRVATRECCRCRLSVCPSPAPQIVVVVCPCGSTGCLGTSSPSDPVGDPGCCCCRHCQWCRLFASLLSVVVGSGGSGCRCRHLVWVALVVDVALVLSPLSVGGCCCCRQWWPVLWWS